MHCPINPFPNFSFEYFICLFFMLCVFVYYYNVPEELDLRKNNELCCRINNKADKEKKDEVRKHL